MCKNEFLDYIKQLYNLDHIDGSEICIIGDRITTDILFGNRMNSFTVLTEVFDDSVRSYGIEIFRFFEINLLKRFFRLNDLQKQFFNEKKIEFERLIKNKTNFN